MVDGQDTWLEEVLVLVLLLHTSITCQSYYYRLGCQEDFHGGHQPGSAHEAASNHRRVQMLEAVAEERKRGLEERKRI